jgi:mono/diheme cytochrome c family protein
VGSCRLVWYAAYGTALTVLAAAGCAQKNDYPPNLAFPSRTDLLVLKSAEITPTSLTEKQTVDEDIARFRDLGGKTADPRSAPADARAAIDALLKEAFGAPAASKIALPDDPAVQHRAEALGLTPDSLTQGGKLFRYHCLRCHNITGDGRGPAAHSMYPFPRDYRRGQFKFVTSLQGGKPRRADLTRTLTEGVRGTAMPPFGLLPEPERDLLARYVTYLSIRGQVEFEAFAAVLAGETSDPLGFASGRVKAILAEWEKAEAAPTVPAAPNDGVPGSATHQAAVKRGYDLFIRKTDNSCITCHGEFGRKPVLRYDVWGTVAKPANLAATDPIYKGGARAEDIFARIRGGIAPVGMPAHPELTERQVWDLVRFVKSLPNPHELPPEIRKAVYPEMGGVP